MSFVLLGILNSQAAGAGQAYFLSLLGGADRDELFGIAKGSSGSFYIGGAATKSGDSDRRLFLSKVAKNGSLEWQKILGDGSGSEIAFGISVDASENIITAGYANFGGESVYKPSITKWDSSGNLQWQRGLDMEIFSDYSSSANDSSNNYYAAGARREDIPGSNRDKGFLTKYNSSGTNQWQRQLDPGFGETGIHESVVVDSSGDIIVSGRDISDCFIAKYNSSGTLQWQRNLSGLSFDQFLGVVTDSSNNIYATGRHGSPSNKKDIILAKYNSSGALQWQRILSGAEDEEAKGIATDSLDNIYLVGDTESTPVSNSIIIAKYDSSGTIQWQRYIGAAGGTERGYGIDVDDNDNVLLSGFSTSAGSGGNDGFFAVLPSDGSLTGTYSLDGVNYTYDASSLTSSTSTLTDSAANQTGSSQTFSDETTTFTPENSTFTQYTAIL